MGIQTICKMLFRQKFKIAKVYAWKVITGTVGKELQGLSYSIHQNVSVPIAESSDPHSCEMWDIVIGIGGMVNKFDSIHNGKRGDMEKIHHTVEIRPEEIVIIRIQADEYLMPNDVLSQTGWNCGASFGVVSSSGEYWSDRLTSKISSSLDKWDFGYDIGDKEEMMIRLWLENENNAIDYKPRKL